MERKMNRVFRQEGYTFLEVAIAFTVVFMISALMTHIITAGRGSATLQEAHSNLRTYQEAVVLYYAHNEEAPTNEQLYKSFLKGKKDLGFRVIAANDFVMNIDRLKPEASDSAPIADLLDVDEQEFIEMPKKWIIISEETFHPKAEFVYVVDDNVPVVVPPGKAPFDQKKVLNLQPTFETDNPLFD